MLPISNWIYVPRSFLTTWCLPKEKIKRNREKNFDSLHKRKYIKVKDRPFAVGRRGCHALICLYAQLLSVKERHIIMPLKIATFIMQSVAFIPCHPSLYNAQFSLTLNDLTLLEAIFIAFLHRWQLTWGILLNPYVGMVDTWKWFGVKGFWMHK